MKNIFLATNLKVLRKRVKYSQEETSSQLGISRSAYNSYENGGIEPNLNTLLSIADIFEVSLDILVKKDLTKYSEKQLDQLNNSNLTDLKGTKLRILATTVNQNNEDNIELVPMQARAGYTTGFADPDFIKLLPTFNLPFLSDKKKYRTFPIKGDSMPPVKNGAYVTAEYLSNWHLIQNGFPYIVITQDDGIVFKMIYHDLRNSPTLTLCSTNLEYDPYEVNVDEIKEVWKFVNYINHEFEPQNFENNQITSTLLDIKKDINDLKRSVN
mgnify:CR=1 FL=1